MWRLDYLYIELLISKPCFLIENLSSLLGCVCYDEKCFLENNF